MAQASKPEKDSGEPAASAGKPGESDVQRRMREVLEAKLAKSKATQGEDHLGARGLGPSTNDKKTRQFRRKSGG